MPKSKTHKGMRKRVKVNAAGKYFLQKSHKRHLLKNKSVKAKNDFRSGKPVSAVDRRNIHRLIHI